MRIILIQFQEWLLNFVTTRSLFPKYNAEIFILFFWKLGGGEAEHCVANNTLLEAKK